MSDFVEPYKPYLKSEAAAAGGIPGAKAAPGAVAPAAPKPVYTDYDTAAMEAANTPASSPAPEGSTDYDAAARQAGEAYTKQRVELMDAYSFMTPVSDAQYRVISRNLAQIAEEGGDVAGTAFKWAAAIEYGRYFQRPAEDIMRDFDTYHMAWMGQPFGAKPTDLRAIKDSFVVGTLSIDLGKLAMQWKNTGGTDSEIEKQLDALRNQMDQLQDSYPRSWFVEALKAGAQAAPYTIQVAGKGAMAAMAGAGVVAASGATAATLGGASPAVVAAAIGAARSAASFQESMQMMEGLAYYDMRKRGIRHDIAAPMAFVSGGVQAVIESSLGNIAKLVGPAGKLSPAAATNATSAIMKHLVASGKLGMLGTALASYGAEAVEEGTEELLQSLADAVIQEGAASLEGDGVDRKTAQEIMANAWGEFKGGFEASLLMGIPGTAIGYKGDAQQARTLSAFAGTVDKDDFIFRAKDLDLPMFEGLTSKDKSEALGKIWDAQQARKIKETAAAPERVPEADVEVLPGEEDVEPGSIPVRRTAEGTVRTQLGEVHDRPDGSTEAVVKAGSPDAPDRYGYARYSTDGDTVRISEVVTRAGVTDEAEVRRALVLEVAAQNPGLAVEWDTKSEKNQEVRDRIIRENPRGADAGLQWYAADEKPQDTRTRNEFRAKILSTFRNVSSEQAEAITALSERRAARVGLSLEAYRNKYISGVTTETPGDVQAAQKAGKRILGATVIRDGKALVYAAKNADFSTLAHEFMHVWENEVQETGGEDLSRLEKAFGIEPGQWTDEKREQVAYSWEEFLRSGKAETQELRSIFQRIADWMRDIYRKFMGKIEITPEIRDAFETLFKDPESPLFVTNTEESAVSTQDGHQGAHEASDGKTYGKAGGPAFALARGANPDNLAAGTEGRNLLQEDFSVIGAEVAGSITRNFTGNKPVQPVETLDEAYALVEAAHSDLVAFGEEYRSKFGGDLHHRPGLKKQEEAARKIAEGDAPNAILDLDGSTLLVSPEDLARVAAALDSDDRVVWIKNRISKAGADGYRDILANIRMPNGAIVEFLVMTPQMWEAKKKPGHSFYEVFREVKKAHNEGKIDAKKALDAITAAERKLYDAAWAASLTGDASFSASSLDMIVEWKMIEASSLPVDLLNVLSGKTRKTFQDLSNAYGAPVASVSTKVNEGSSNEGMGTSLIKTSTTSIVQPGGGRKGGGAFFQEADPIDSQTFKNWFGTSVVKTRGGKPKVVYHTTGHAGQFESFDPNKSDLGIHFGDQDAANITAQRYQIAGEYASGYHVGIIPVYLNLKNPLRLTDEGSFMAGAIADQLVNKKIIDRATAKDWKKTKNYSQEEKDTIAAREAIQKAGYDGVVYRNKREGTGDSYIIFNSNQAKSVFNRTPTNDPRILFQEEIGDYRGTYPHVRGGWTKAKILRALKEANSKVFSTLGMSKEIAKFSDPKELMDNIYYHGSPNYPTSGLKPSIIRSEHWAEQNGGGGYGMRYWGVSLSKRKRQAEAFSGQSRHVNVFPVILRKGAVVKEIEGIDDAADIEEHIEQLWNDGIDAVWIGGGEDELLVINPLAIAMYKNPDFYEVFGGFKSEDLTLEKAEKLYHAAQENLAKLEGLPREERIKLAAELPRLLFQSEDALRGEARTFGTWREFMEFVEATDSQDDPEVETLKEGEKEKWYRDFWEEANRSKLEPLSPQAADARFRAIIESKDGLDEFLGEIYNVMTESFHEAPQDAEEQAEYERRLDLQSKLKAMHPTVQNNAVRIGLGRPLTDRARAAIETLMSSGATYYRRLYAQVMNDQDLSNVDKEAEKQSLPNIEDPRLGDDSSLSIVERMKLIKSIQNEELRKRLARGDIVPERDMIALIEEAEKEKAALQKDLDAKQAEINDDYRMFTAHERTFSEQRERIRGLEAEAVAAQKKIDRLIERGKSVSEALSSARQEAALQAEAIRRQLSGMRQTERTKAREAKQQAIAEIREKMRAAEQKRRDAKKIIDLKKSIANKIMERPSVAISYEKRIQIEALQKTLDPHFRRAKLKWRGEMVYIEDLLRNTQFLQDAALEARLVERLDKKPLNAWTVAELEELLAQIVELTNQGRQEWAAEVQARKAMGIRSSRRITEASYKSGKYVSAAPAGSAERREQLKKLNSPWKRLQLKALNVARVANMLDFGQEGENTRLLVTEANRAYDQKMNNLDRRAEAIKKALKAAGYKGETVAELARGLWERKYTIEGVGPENSAATFTADDLMYIAVALKDKHTRAAILYGNLATERERLYQDKDVMKSWAGTKIEILEKALKEYLTEADWAIIHAVENDYRDEFGRLNALFIQEFNVAMKSVGMYVPMFRESTASMDMAHEKQQAEEVLNVGGISIKRNPEKGFTHDRVDIGAKNQRAIQLGLISTWLKATEREEHFHAYTPYVRQLNRVYKSNSWFSRGARDAIVNTHGSECLKYVENYINEVANPRSNTDDMNRIVRAFRGDLGAAYLGWKLSGVVKQLVTSPMPYLGYVSALDMTKAAFEFTAKHKEMEEFIKSRSAYMRHRVQNPIFQAMKDAAADPKVKQILGGFKAVGMKGLEWADWTSVAVGWKATYDKALSAGKTEVQAVEYADEVTQKCQPSARPEDLAPLFKTGSEFTRAFTQFQTALNVIWNQISYDIPVAIKNKQYKYAVAQVASYVLAGILLGMVTRGKEDDDETRLDDFFFWSLTQFTDSVPLIGSQVTSLWRQVVTGQMDSPYTTPLMPAIDELFAGAKDLTEGDWARAAKNFGEGIGLFLGLPASGAKELIKTTKEGPGALVGRRKE